MPSYGAGSFFNGCGHFGEYGKWRDQLCRYKCMRRKYCKEVAEATKAPLGDLPQYLTSKRLSVRLAAKARFIELEERND